ncbi:MAG: hypothetical protein AAFU79_33150, partial [Myxococcota bacterium]
MDAFLDLLAAWGRWMATRPEDPTAGFVRRPSSPPPRPRPAPKSGSSLCPADGTPLIAGPEPYAAVRLCPTCHGCFLPRGLFERLRSDPASLDGIEAVVPTAEVKPEAPRYRRCPICNEQMSPEVLEAHRVLDRRDAAALRFPSRARRCWTSHAPRVLEDQRHGTAAKMA